MNTALHILRSLLYFWVPFAVTLAALTAVARHFTRLTLRLTAGSVLFLAAVTMVAFGAAGHPERTPLTAFDVEFDTAVQYFWAPFYGGQRYMPGDGSGAGVWILALVVLAGCYYGLELASARRESPRVDVGDPGDTDTTTRQILTELNFRLPAVELRKPASVPGAAAETGAAVASVVEATEAQGSAVVGALVRLGRVLLPQPPAYLVKVCANDCGLTDERDPAIRMTVDVRERRTGRSIAVKTFDRVPVAGAAARAAGFVATRLFTIDHSAPPWVAGTFDGEDLASYLLDLQPERPRRTHGEVRHDRLGRIERMQSVIHDGPASGIVRYELAALYELENRHIEALRLYTLNRLQYPYFHRNTYRFAGSLSMLAGAINDVWRECGTHDDAQELRTTRADIYRYLKEAGLVTQVLGQEPPDEQEFTNATNGVDEVASFFAALAVREFTEYDKQLRLPRLAWTCLCHRTQRSSLLKYFAHGKDRRVARAEARTVLDLAKARHERAAASTRDTLVAPAGAASPETARPDPSWVVTYNRACFFAWAYAHPNDAADRDAARAAAVKLINAAIDYPSSIRRPSEVIGVDPDLRPLRGDASGAGEFEELVREQLRRDFARPKKPDEPDAPLDDWFRAQVDIALAPASVSATPSAQRS